MGLFRQASSVPRQEINGAETIFWKAIGLQKKEETLIREMHANIKQGLDIDPTSLETLTEVHHHVARALNGLDFTDPDSAEVLAVAKSIEVNDGTFARMILQVAGEDATPFFEAVYNAHGFRLPKGKNAMVHEAGQAVIESGYGLALRVQGLDQDLRAALFRNSARTGDRLGKTMSAIETAEMKDSGYGAYAVVFEKLTADNARAAIEGYFRHYFGIDNFSLVNLGPLHGLDAKPYHKRENDKTLKLPYAVRTQANPVFTGEIGYLEDAASVDPMLAAEAYLAISLLLESRGRYHDRISAGFRTKGQQKLAEALERTPNLSALGKVRVVKPFNERSAEYAKLSSGDQQMAQDYASLAKRASTLNTLIATSINPVDS